MDGRKMWRAYLCLTLGAALLGGIMAALCRGARAATSYVVNSAADVRPSIVPVWTAKHTFNGTVSVGSSIYLTLLPNVVFIGTTTGGQVVAGSLNAPLVSSGNAISITKADSTHDGYLSQGDWNAFNGKLGSEGDPLSLHTSGGSNTMSQSILTSSSSVNVGSSGTPFGSMYASNYFLGAVDALFTSGSNTCLGSAHSVFLSPGGGASDQIVFSTSNPVNFNGGPFATTVGAAGGATAPPAAPVGYLHLQVDGTTYAVPYYNP